MSTLRLMPHALRCRACGSEEDLFFTFTGFFPAESAGTVAPCREVVSAVGARRGSRPAGGGRAVTATLTSQRCVNSCGGMSNSILCRVPSSIRSCSSPRLLLCRLYALQNLRAAASGVKLAEPGSILSRTQRSPPNGEAVWQYTFIVSVGRHSARRTTRKIHNRERVRF